MTLRARLALLVAAAVAVAIAMASVAAFLVTRAEVGGVHFRVITVPMPDGLGGAVQLARPLTEIDQTLAGLGLLLAVLGGLGGVLLGAAVTAGYAASRGWQIMVPASAVGAGIAAALLIGAIAGLYPAVRAARLSPTDALRAA